MNWRKQSFGEYEGRYFLVGEAYDLAVGLGKKAKPISLGRLRRNFTEGGWDKDFDSVQKADCRFPILLVRCGKTLWVADGMHRLWKAKLNGLKLRARILEEAELLKL